MRFTALRAARTTTDSGIVAVPVVIPTGLDDHHAAEVAVGCRGVASLKVSVATADIGQPVIQNNPLPFLLNWTDWFRAASSSQT